MAQRRQTNPAIIVFEDILTSLANYYQDLPIDPDAIKSHATRITVNNLFNQVILQLGRAQIDVTPHLRRLVNKRANIEYAIHRAHGTTERTHPIDATYYF